MFSKDVLTELQKTELQRQIQGVIDTNGAKVPLVALASGFSIDSLEKYMPNASFYRLNFNTSFIADFIEFGKKNAKDGSLCFVNSDNPTALSASLIIDVGTIDAPLHKKHNSKLTLKATTAYKTVLNTDGQQFTQKAISEFLEDWIDYIEVEAANGDAMPVLAASEKLRNLTIEAARNTTNTVDDFGESASAFEKIEAANKDQLPSLIKFTAIPFVGFEPVVFNMRIGILTGSEKPQVSVRVQRLEIEQEYIAELFELKISTGFSDTDIIVYMGTAE